MKKYLKPRAYMLFSLGQIIYVFYIYFIEKDIKLMWTLVTNAIQIGLILWGRLTGNRWWLLTILFSVTYVTLDLLSNRGPVILMIETLTLNPQTAWWRVHIWNFGTQSVMAHPFLGIGLNDWARPEWLASTVDNFWLLLAMRHGLPAALMLVLGLVWHVWQIIRARDLSDADAQIRTAYIISFVALCFGLSTVHAWGAPSVLIMFYFGMGSYFYTGGTQPAGPGETSAISADPRAPLPYTRFLQHHASGSVTPTLVLPRQHSVRGRTNEQPNRAQT